MDFTSLGLLALVGLFGVMLLLLEAGRRLAVFRSETDLEKERAGAGPIDAAVYSLMALLIAFTFTSAASRFEARRGLVVEETNDIGTAWLRLDLLPAEPRASLREKFRHYVDARIAVYHRMPDLDAAREELDKGTALQNQIWTEAVAATRDSGTPVASMLLLPAINQMIDITTTRTMAARYHTPSLIYAVLGLLVLASALLAGYGMARRGKRDLIHSRALLVVMTLALYVTLDFEYPHLGLIRIHDAEQVLVDFRQTMNS